MDLRSMAINIGWNINESPLIQANALTDAFKDSVITIKDDMEVFGNVSESASHQVSDGMREAQEHMQGFGNASESATNQLSDGMREVQEQFRGIGDQSRRTTEEMKSGLDEVNQSLRDMVDDASTAFGALKSGLGVLAAGGVLSYFTSATIGAEETQARFKWFASETEDDLAILNNSIRETTELTRGFFSESELQEAFMSNANLGANFFAEFADSAAVLAVKMGTGMDQTMRFFGNAINKGAVGPLIDLGVITEGTFASIGEELTDNIKEWDEHRKQLLLSVAAQEFMTNNIKGMNEYFKTTDVRLGVFKHHLNDVVGIMGSPLNHVFNQILSVTNELFDAIKDNPVAQFALKAIGWATGIGALGLAFLSIGQAVKKLYPIMAPLVRPFIRFFAIATATYWIIEDLIFAFFGLGDSVTESLFNATMDFLGFEYTFQDLRETVVGGLQTMGGWFVTAADYLRDNWEWISPFLIGLAIAWGGLKVATIAMQAPTVIMTGLTHALTAAQWLWNAAMTANPIGLVIVGIGALIGAGILLWKHWDTLKELAFGLWDDLKDSFGSGIDWTKDKLTEWRDWGLDMIDGLIEGFLNLPGTVMDGLANFGSDLKNTFTDALGGLRNMLPFSPAKEGPLVDLHESGSNIIGNIQEGINRAQELSIQHKLAPAAQQAEEPIPVSIPRFGGGGTEVFSPTIQVTISGGYSTDTEEQIRQAKEEVEKQIIPILENYFRRLQSKYPWTTES